MPMDLTPLEGEDVPTITIRPDDFPKDEGFHILRFLDQSVLDLARAEATTSTVERGRVVETLNNDTYNRVIVRHQLKDWKVRDRAKQWIPCTPENIDRLGWMVAQYIANEAVKRGGFIPTEDLTVTDDKGRVLDFRGENTGLHHGKSKAEVSVQK